MKKYIAILVCAVLLTGLTACGNDTPKGEDTPATTTTTSATTTTGEGSTTTSATTSTTTEDTAASDTTSATATTGGSVTTAAPSYTEGTTTTVTQKPTTTVTTAPSRPASSATATTTGSKPTASTTVTTQPTVPQPKVALPAVGSDIDVVKQKDRIRVSAATAVYNKDGSIAVSLTFTNYSSNWITEETDWVEYTCYDKSGNVVQKATKLYIGCIDTKKNSVKTYTFDVPAATAEVRLTDSKIVYWTEWS
ncbi:MAG: hypothetical protein IKL13_04255 [Clostridia bacterium]|nr:hypothetical protein [Clostridia bacterium]